ncbi:MAG: hypothetical protein JXA62_00665 [Candidatus Aminicenantes bacterium]|nr:hypothetical protein [Candidatus Aminicenantes bacterium]
MPLHRDSFKVLLRHFLRDAFMSEDDGLGRHGIGSMTLVLAGLVILGTVLTMDVLIKYLMFGWFQFATPHQVQVEKLRFFSFQAAVSGIIVCAGARTFILRGRDYILACSRPVKGSALVGAKAAAAALFVLLIAAAYSLPAALTFTLFTSDAAKINPLRMLFSLLGGAALQTLSILFVMLLLMGTLEFMAGFRVARFFASLVHGGAVLFFVAVFFWFPGVYEQMLAAHPAVPANLDWWPPAWLAGFSPPLEPGILLLLAIVFPALAYIFYLHAALAAFRVGGVAGGAKRQARSIRHVFFFPATFSRFLALVSFFRLTLKRSRRLRSIVLSITAAALSLGLVPLAARWFEGGNNAGFADLLPLLPLLLNFGLACAMRFCVLQAVESRAAWLFRLNLTAAGHPRLALLTAFILDLLLPLNLLLLAMLVFPLGIFAALKLAFFHAAMGLVLAATILLDVSWMPFSAPGMAEEEGVKLALIRWLLGAFIYYWSMRALGDIILKGGTPAVLVGALPIPAAAILVMVLYVRGRNNKLLFEAES